MSSKAGLHVPDDPSPEVLTDVLKDADDNIFVLDPDAVIRDVNGAQVVFTPDEFAHIDLNDGSVWTPSGEQEVVSPPVYTSDALAAAGFGADQNP